MTVFLLSVPCDLHVLPGHRSRVALRIVGASRNRGGPGSCQWPHRASMRQRLSLARKQSGRTRWITEAAIDIPKEVVGDRRQWHGQQRPEPAKAAQDDDRDD